MRGGIYSGEHCPVCGATFTDTGRDLECPEHHTRPRHYYIQIYNRTLRKHVNIKTDPKTRAPFYAYELANRLLGTIRAEIDASGTKDFDASRYVATKLKPYRFDTWIDAWLTRKATEVEKGHRSPSYLKLLRIYARKWKGFFGQADIRDIGTKKIEDFYLSLSGASHYIKNIMDALEKAFADAGRWGDVKTIPVFPQVEMEEPEIKTIDLDVQDQIIASIPNQMDRVFILVTARLMLRPCEPRALQWEDVDFKHHQITIRRHFSLNKIRSTTKAKRIRRLPMDGETEQALLALPRHLVSPFVFWKGNGRPFSESWARKVWGVVRAQFGTDISLYAGTKHSSATEAADRVGVDATQAFLDHTNRRTTLKYVRANPERLRKVLRKAEGE